MKIADFRCALVTGANSGLGKEIATLLKEQNVPLITITRSEVDLAKSRESLIEIIQTKAPDLIINNAGFGLYGDALAFTTKQQLDILEVNAKALLEITLEGARALIARKSKGVIMNISSATAYFPFPDFSVYAASKAFVNSVSVGLDEELAKHGIRVLTCCPGQISTNFRKKASRGFPQKESGISMDAKKAAELILKQIENEKRIQIIDWRTRFFIAITKLIPQKILGKILKRNLRSRWVFHT